MHPASILRRHARTTIYLDTESAALLKSTSRAAQSLDP
jgi:6-phosphogluconolactonase/glucosamine-6-phosphate isomerase/deaminase